ncbi:unnamed protein product (macronuclear) [Paramecium tetraurelia]|uniref:MORN repeat protein n=1 Tax=Paramecium tetraurelia TaxID=5888 RepID=A0D1Y7_PARTE|nr:uncharacterized protein GSPATT00039188001 [Paramecium tetraurelia]CAK77054.1 unnamed protein product [Paramecium tetraurelia]|eukprot:XP_001444451.1 hypothetical protein (macronuclear) [Paramecium tetraurelia strain d4-2]
MEYLLEQQYNFVITQHLMLLIEEEVVMMKLEQKMEIGLKLLKIFKGLNQFYHTRLNYVTYQGQYDGGKRRGLWKANYQKKTINLGCYDENGLKNGKWVNLYKFFNSSCRVIFIGQYNHGMKIGQWNIQQKKQIIGGGMYNDEGKKIGVWKELQKNFQLDFEVFYTGLYEQGIRQGEWKIYFQDRLIGGGNYDQQGMKHGVWKDAHQNFSYRIQVTYQGEYVEGWKKGRWNILVIDQIIGGGDYDEGVKQGKWIEVDDKYAEYTDYLSQIATVQFYALENIHMV